MKNKMPFVLIILLLLAVNSNASFLVKKTYFVKHNTKTDSSKTDSTKTEKSKKKKSVKSYKKLLKGAKTIDGMFKIHQKEGKIYIEIPNKIMDKTYLISSRVTAVSNNFNTTSGRMVKKPVMISFSHDKKNVYIHKPSYQRRTAPNSELITSLKRNSINPIWYVYEIKAFGKDSLSCVVDMTDIFYTKIPDLNPFEAKRTIMGAMTPKGSADKKSSKILSCKAFNKNINVKTRLCYTIKQKPYTVEVSRNIIMLKDKPMQMRYADKRIGFFKHNFTFFDENIDGSIKKEMIHKWDIKPRKEDLNRYKNGELVVPEKQIIWYVDTAIPTKWRKYIKQGIEYWQKAFEEIGFKNAIIAKEYPTNNPDFDPDDISFNCYRFVTVNIQNSQGPSWIDPRSGEILGGDVMFYSDIIKLLHNWRFVQTAAVDKRVRKKVFSDEIMGESLRYVAAHEIGHTLGLLHNFGASSSIPVDSLRSATFTKKHGTTASIMDYARFNYVAQPGDIEKGIKLIPPKLGVYDMFAIKWGYQPIFTAKNAEDEHKTLNKWLIDSNKNPMLKYGEQSMSKFCDPDNLSEDLSSDIVKANTYGLNNLKILVQNLDAWTLEKYDDYTYYKEIYTEIFKQFNRYMVHLLKHVSGMHLKDVVYGDNQIAKQFLSKQEQKRVVKTTLKMMYEYPLWINNQTAKNIMPENMLKATNTQNKILNWLCKKDIMMRLNIFEQLDAKNAYTYNEYAKDIYDFIWAKTIKSKNLTLNDRNLQNMYLDAMFKMVSSDKLLESAYKKSQSFSADALVKKEITSSNSLLQSLGSPVNYLILNDLHALLKKEKNKGNAATRDHYKTLFFKLDRFLD